MAGAANAASISYTASTDGAAIVGSTGGGFIQLPDFDSVLGTLTGITIEFTGSWSDEYRAVADTAAGDASAADDFATATIANTFTTPGVSFADITDDAGLAFDVFVDFGAPYGQVVSGALSSTENVLAAFFGGFTDVGTVTFGFDGDADQSSSADSGVLTGLVDFAYDLDATITYTYTAPPSDVPVPAALPLLAAAFGVMGLVRARRA
ncbi:choice-of-anchor E domain-containing protein [Rhodovulum sp. DZ06]|uniref:choice-of-anchor E domain-containing protein n=1 Tax=Rhodovulum sp. DZ06 TaxID=3425126 RepID=UPI003D32540A